MVQTLFLKYILEKAEEVKEEFGGERLTASHVVVAVADFCKTRYTGLEYFYLAYPRFEEERVRYIFSKEIKLAGYLRLALSINTKKGVHEAEFDLEACERIALARDADILSVDVVFVCALMQLQEKYRSTLRTVSTEQSIFALLEETDKNIYDYAISRIEELRRILKEKAEKAAEIRDWKPAKKFVEPEELRELLFKSIKKSTDGKVITLKLPRFFGSSDLKVSIHQAKGRYYINDNGCAKKYLLKRLGDKQKCERVLSKICSPYWINKNNITGYFTNANGFFAFLKRVVFIANADLYYTRANLGACKREKGYAYIPANKAEPLDEAKLIDLLKSGVGSNYDKNRGLYIWFDAHCTLSSSRVFFQIETLEDNLIRFSDLKKGQYEGEIFEEFYWCNSDITPYKKSVESINARFGADFDGKNIYLTEKQENYSKAVFKFFNLAIIFSEFGHDIALPKIRGQKR